MFNFLKNKEVVLAEKLMKLQVEVSASKFAKNTKIKRVAILTTESIVEKIKLQKLVEESLQVKDAKMYIFRDFDKEDEISLTHFSKNEISKNGKITEENFNTFLKESFDLLICFFDSNNIYLEFAAATSKAIYKVGFAEVNSDLFDLEIHSNAYNVREFLSELKKYLSILKKL